MRRASTTACQDLLIVKRSCDHASHPRANRHGSCNRDGRNEHLLPTARHVSVVLKTVPVPHVDEHEGEENRIADGIAAVSDTVKVQSAAHSGVAQESRLALGGFSILRSLRLLSTRKASPNEPSMAPRSQCARSGVPPQGPGQAWHMKTKAEGRREGKNKRGKKINRIRTDYCWFVP
ncbi:unnamed protein product [Prorocentrum cordatum]|uniref:Uncharacterized protein n=1 Tax=Prorocentrum cordatum TaxID=2364126 RepID=A0ABN9XMZ8_9DINO|nr:unnamed protein product [Polarella glacialis]